eukprot:1684343-Amphidinium_carterae.2
MTRLAMTDPGELLQHHGYVATMNKSRRAEESGSCSSSSRVGEQTVTATCRLLRLCQKHMENVYGMGRFTRVCSCVMSSHDIANVANRPGILL